LIDFHFDPPEFWLKKNPKTISYAVDPIFTLLIMNQKNLPNTKATVEAQSVASIEHFDPVNDNLDSLFSFTLSPTSTHVAPFSLTKSFEENGAD
jgi:hypothetical protein